VLGVLELTLDLLAALLEHRVDARQHPLLHEVVQDAERDRTDDEFLPVRPEVRRVVGLLLDVRLRLREERDDRCEHRGGPSP
jgi:hypothetical protein